MRPALSLVLVPLAVLSGCSRSPPPAPVAPPPTVSSSPPEGARSQEEVAAARRDAGRAPPSAGASPHPGGDGGTPQVRVKIGPLTRFQIVPMGEAAVAPAGGTLDALRARYVAYGFDLGPIVPMPSPPPRSCAELLTSRVVTRGAIFVVPGTLPCPTPFGAVNPALGTGLVPLGPLGPWGPVAERRLTAVVGSIVAELIGLSMPCSDGRRCCALRKAPDAKTLDIQAAASCPAHASELDRIREASGLQ